MERIGHAFIDDILRIIRSDKKDEGKKRIERAIELAYQTGRRSVQDAIRTALGMPDSNSDEDYFSDEDVV